MRAIEVRALELAFVFGGGLPWGKVLSITVGCRSADSVGTDARDLLVFAGGAISVSPPALSHQ